MSTIEAPATSIPVGITTFASAMEVLEWYRDGIIDKKEARLLVGLDSERLTTIDAA